MDVPETVDVLAPGAPAVATYVDAGSCSACGATAKCDPCGNWWHVGPSCLPPHVHNPGVIFLSNTDKPPATQRAKPDQAGAGQPAQRQEKAAPADREQRGAPRDRALGNSDDSGGRR